MKIAFVVLQFYPFHTGGVGNATLKFAEALSNRDHKIDIFTQKGVVDDVPDFETYHGINIHRLKGSINPFSILAFIPFVLGASLKMNKIKPDIIFGQMVYTGGTVSAIIGKIFRKVPITMAHGADVDELHTKFARIVTKFALKHNDVLITTNTEFKNKLSQYTAKSIHILPNIIDEIHIEYSRTECRQKLKLDETKTHLLAIGRLVRVHGIETKGISYIIEAMKNLDHCELHILGEGPLLLEFKEYILNNNLENVHLYGAVPYQKVLGFMKASDCLVFPSITEGLSMVMIEAMALGLPIITTKIGGAADYIVEGENGLLVERKSSKSIEDAVRKILNNPKLQKKLGENAYKTYKNNFTAEEVVRRFEEILRLNGVIK